MPGHSLSKSLHKGSDSVVTGSIIWEWFIWMCAKIFFLNLEQAQKSSFSVVQSYKRAHLQEKYH